MLNLTVTVIFSYFDCPADAKDKMRNARERKRRTEKQQTGKEEEEEEEEEEIIHKNLRGEKQRATPEQQQRRRRRRSEIYRRRISISIWAFIVLVKFAGKSSKFCMETEEERNNQRASEPEFFLQWGNRKRLRCVRVKGSEIAAERFKFNGGMCRTITSSRIHRFAVSTSGKDISGFQSNRLTRNSDGNRKSSSPEKEERYYTRRGSVGVDESCNGNGNGKVMMDGNNVEDRGLVWPKLYITLSSKEKEEDFLAMKGCKLPQRPKKRAKLIQRSLLLVSPGAWLTDMCQERYEVREKKSTKKKSRGLKAMGSLETDSE
ncbi:hypothetical protein FF1_013710 [Malus domestica]